MVVSTSEEWHSLVNLTPDLKGVAHDLQSSILKCINISKAYLDGEIKMPSCRGKTWSPGNKSRIPRSVISNESTSCPFNLRIRLGLFPIMIKS